MFQLTANGKSRTVPSLGELDRLLRRGIIDQRTPVTHQKSGVQRSVEDWLLGPKDDESSGSDSNTDYQVEVARMLNLLRSRPAGSFSDEELATVKRFLRNMVKNDRDKLVDEDLMFRFRKQLRRTTAEQIVAKQDVKVSVQDLLHPNMTHEQAEHYRQALRFGAEYGASVPKPTYTTRGYQGNMRYRSLPSDSVPGEAAPAPAPTPSGDDRSWFHHPLIIVVALIFLPPLGLLLLWTSPRKGVFGNFMVRMIITGIAVNGLSQEEWYSYELRNAYQTLAPFPVMSVGEGFNQPYWLPDILRDTFEVGEEITYTVQKLSCPEPTLRDEVVLEAFGKQEALVVREPEWTPDDSRYMGKVVAEHGGVYYFRLYCGDRILAQAQASVLAP